MPVIVDDRGQNNSVVIAGRDAPELTGRIVLTGSNNVVSIGAGCVATDFYAELGEHSRLSIGGGCILGRLFVFALRAGVVSIGESCGFNGVIRLLAHEPGRIAIGAGCLFGGETDVTLSDMHSVLDISTGLRINPAADVVLGDSVWVGQRSTILKGSTIGTGSVIGASSVVTGAIPATASAAGNPAKVIRTGVTWRHQLM